MASLDTARLLEEKASTAALSGANLQSSGGRLSAIAADIATLGTGTLLAAVFNAALVFIIPRLISVEDYGYWRIFVLYSGYVGFLHFGYADGALIRWAGRPWDDFHREIAPALSYLFCQHVIILLPSCVIAAFVLRGPSRFVVVALALYAVVFNEAALLQFGLQDAKIFGPVALSTAGAPALFFALVLLWSTKWRSGYREISEFYVAGWLIVLILLLVWTKPWSGARPEVPARRQAKDWLLVGWPIVVTNTAVSLIQCADRFAVSWAATIHSFAQYSLAGSAMAVPMTAIQACSNVSFSHLARVSAGERKQIYGISLRLLLIAWAVLLPYYFVLDTFVRHVLPRYIDSLQYARVLLLSIPFLAAIQVLQVNYAYLNGIQRQFLVRTLSVLAVSIGITSLVAFHVASLRVVAGVQVAVVAGWWLFNEWVLREFTGQGSGDWVRFGAIYGLAGLSYWLTSGRGINVAVSIALYFLMTSIIVAICARNDLSFLFTRMRLRLAPARCE